MALSPTNMLVLCLLVLLSLHHGDTQESFPLPTLSFESSVNQSNIQLLSSVKLHCTIPKTAPFPVHVSLGKANIPNPTSNAMGTFKNLNGPDYIIFTISATLENEGPLVCWYEASKTGKISSFSNSVNMFISSIQNPILIIYPPVMAFGKSYVVQCETPNLQFTNATVSLFKRPYPVTPGHEAFEYIGSRLLAPNDFGGSITHTDAFEFRCDFQMLFKGRTMQSVSKIATAEPEELPARLHSSTLDTATCAGNLYVKSKDKWRPVCFSTSKENDSYVATVACRDLGCGNSFDSERVTETSAYVLGTPNCTGSENKLADCPMVNQRACTTQTLRVICDAAVPSPKLSVLGYHSVEWLYFKTEESLTITCSFTSTSLAERDSVYITFTRNGRELYTTSSNPGRTELYNMYAPVTEGTYSCHVQLSSRSNLKKSSNLVHLYIYNPPPVGAVVAGVLTSVAGIAILVFLCVFRTSKDEELQPIHQVEAEQALQAGPEMSHTQIPQA